MKQGEHNKARKSDRRCDYESKDLLFSGTGNSMRAVEKSPQVRRLTEDFLLIYKII